MVLNSAKMTWSTLKVKFIQNCFFDLEILASMALALMSVPRGVWPSPEYEGLVSPPHTKAHPHPPPLAGCSGKLKEGNKAKK